MSSVRTALAAAALVACATEPPPAPDPDLATAWGCAVLDTCPLPVPELVGEQLFVRAWTPGDSRAGGDGLGPLFNADSCVTCHSAPGVGGAGGAEVNAQFIARNGVVEALHRAGTSPDFEEWRTRQEARVGGLGMLGFGKRLGAIRSTRAFHPPPALIERNTPALYGAGQVDRIPDAALHALAAAQAKEGRVSGRVGTDAAGRTARFGWKGDVATLHDFVDQACANELGLSTEQRTEPTGPFDERVSTVRADLSTADVHALTAFVAALPAPAVAAVEHPGLATFRSAGCADCHVETVGDVVGLYSDLLIHDMGSRLTDAAGLGAYGAAQLADASGTLPSEFRTPPLWGVADSGPWLHHGLADNLEIAIVQHGGEAAAAQRNYGRLPEPERAALLDFLGSLRAPAPPPGS